MQHVKGHFRVSELSVKGDAWKSHDFSGYDAIVHVAAIVHQRNVPDQDLIFRINRDLPRALCQHAVGQGVKHFVFMSTMAVYGVAPSRAGMPGITLETPCRPRSWYGKSKFEAEQALQELRSRDDFRLSILRPPMVYGRGCPGNYFKRLLWMGRHLPILPSFRKNRLSMIGIANLSELLKNILDTDAEGVFIPDDCDELGTTQRLEIIARASGRNPLASRLLGELIQRVPLRPLDSLVGDLFYAGPRPGPHGSYAVASFEDTIRSILHDSR